MKILAIDASTSNVGWCLAENDKYIASGQWQPTDAKGFDAVLLYREWLFGMMEHIGPDFVFYERPSGVHGNAWTNALLGALWYETWCCSNNNLVLVSPKEIKATGYSKELLKTPAKCADCWWSLGTGREYPDPQTGTAKKRFGDELDAIGCWLAGLERMKNEQG